MLSPQFAQSLRLFIVSLGNIPLFTNHFTRLQPQDFCIQIQDEADRDTGIWVLEVRGIQNIHKFGSSLSQRPQVLWKSRYLGILAEFSRFYSIIPLIDKSNSSGNSLKHITPGCTPMEPHTVSDLSQSQARLSPSTSSESCHGTLHGAQARPEERSHLCSGIRDPTETLPAIRLQLKRNRGGWNMFHLLLFLCVVLLEDPLPGFMSHSCHRNRRTDCSPSPG